MSKGPRPTHFHDEKPAIDGESIVLGLTVGIDWKTELTRELLEQLVVCSKVGGFRKQTAIACGVRPDILEAWISEGMRADAPAMYRELAVRFQASRAQLNLILVGCVARAAQMGDWQAAIAMLSKTDPDWKGETKDSDLSPPELSVEQRKQALVEALRSRSGDLDQALTEAGYPALPKPDDPTTGPQQG